MLCWHDWVPIRESDREFHDRREDNSLSESKWFHHYTIREGDEVFDAETGEMFPIGGSLRLKECSFNSAPISDVICVKCGATKLKLQAMVKKYEKTKTTRIKRERLESKFREHGERKIAMWKDRNRQFEEV